MYETLVVPLWLKKGQASSASVFPWVLNSLIMVMAGQKSNNNADMKIFFEISKRYDFGVVGFRSLRGRIISCPLKIARLMVELDPWNDPHLIRCTSRILPRRRSRRRKEGAKNMLHLNFFFYSSKTGPSSTGLAVTRPGQYPNNFNSFFNSYSDWHNFDNMMRCKSWCVILNNLQ